MYREVIYDNLSNPKMMKMKYPQQQAPDNFEVSSYVYDDLTDQIVERQVFHSNRPSSNLGKRLQPMYPVQDDQVS